MVSYTAAVINKKLKIMTTRFTLVVMIFNFLLENIKLLFQKKKQLNLYILDIMIGIKISNIKSYNDFIEGKDSSPFIEIISFSEGIKSPWKADNFAK